jgi:hypothetical protein
MDLWRSVNFRLGFGRGNNDKEQGVERGNFAR